MRAITHAIGSVIAPLQPAARHGLRILGYHAVGTPLPFEHYGISVAPVRWREQMRDLAECGRVVALAGAGGGPEPAHVLTFDDGYRDLLTVVAPYLAELGLTATAFVTTDYMHAAGDLYLKPREVVELSRCPGIEVGSHCVTHRRLTSCDDASLDRELRASRAILEDCIGRAVTSVAYPHGAVDRRVRRAAEEAGYRAGCTTRYGTNMPGRDPLLLCRTEILAADSLRNFRQKLRGGWDWYGRRHEDPAG